jgi:hypothetical protein
VQTDTNSIEEWLALKIPDSASLGTVDLALRVDTLPPSQSGARVKLLALNCRVEGDAAQVWLDSASGGLMLGSNDPGTPATVIASVPRATWVFVTLSFTKSAGTGTGPAVKTTLVVDKVQGATGTVFPSCTVPLVVRLGATPSPPSAWDLSFDDVVINWSP